MIDARTTQPIDRLSADEIRMGALQHLREIAEKAFGEFDTSNRIDQTMFLRVALDANIAILRHIEADVSI